MVAEDNKLFVGGLPPSCTDAQLQQFASSYGEASEAKIMFDRATQRSRGFGFITFANPDDAQKCLAAKPHTLLGKTIDIQCTEDRPMNTKHLEVGWGPEGNEWKIFVGGLSEDVTNEDLTEKFSEFGGLKDAHVVFDKVTQVSRKFGFLTFTEEAGFDQTLMLEVCEIKGKQVELQPRSVPFNKHYPTNGMLYVGGMAEDVGKEEMQSYFAQFGEVSNPVIMTDHGTGKSRGFGFITFADPKTAYTVMKKDNFMREAKIDVKSSGRNEPLTKGKGKGKGKGMDGGKGGFGGGGFGGFGGWGGYPGYGGMGGGMGGFGGFGGMGMGGMMGGFGGFGGGMGGYSGAYSGYGQQAGGGKGGFGGGHGSSPY